MNLLQSIAKLKLAPVYICLIFFIFVLGVFKVHPIFKDSGDHYQGIAQNLISGKGFSYPIPPKAPPVTELIELTTLWHQNNLVFGSFHPNERMAFWEPGYPAWLAFWMLIFSPAGKMILIIQILVLSSTFLFLIYIGKNQFNYTVGLLSAIALLFNSELLKYPLTFPNENLFIPLFIAGILSWYHCRKSVRWERFAWFSLIWAAAGLTRIVGVTLALFALTSLLIAEKKYFKYISVALLIFTSLWGSWTLRNYYLTGEIVFSTKTGYNLWRANNRDFLDKTLRQAAGQPLTYFSFNAAENRPLLQELGFSQEQIYRFARYDYPLFALTKDELTIDKALKKRFLIFLKENPGEFLKLCWDRFNQDFTDSLIGLGHINYRGLWAVYYAIFFSFSLLGIFIGLLNFRKNWFLLSITLLYFFTLIIGVGGVRMRVPLDPLLALYSALAFVFLYHRILKKSPFDLFANLSSGRLAKDT